MRVRDAEADAKAGPSRPAPAVRVQTPEMPAGAGAGAGVQVEDEELVARARQGDRAAFDLLVIRYKDRIFNLCYRHLGDADDALDAAQDAFLKAYRALGRFEGKSKFYTWLFRIALNTSFTRRKKRGRDKEAVGASLDGCGGGGGAGGHGDAGGGADGHGHGVLGGDPPDERDEPAALALRAEAAAKVQEAIAGLPADFKRIVLLKDVEGQSYEDIAEVLKIPLGSVKSRLHRARLVLRERLRPYVGAGGDDGREGASAA